MAGIAAPPVKAALQNMIRTGEMVNDYLNDMDDLTAMVTNKGFTTIGSTATSPFDDFADNVRGLIDTCCDLQDAGGNRRCSRWYGHAYVNSR